MAQTPRRRNRYPVGADAPDVPLWMSRLATDLEDAPRDGQGTLAARPPQSIGTPGDVGQWWRVTGDSTAANEGRIFRGYGTGYDELQRIVPRVTSLPAFPYEGMLVRYNPGGSARWLLAYDQGLVAPNRWVYLGGAPRPYELDQTLETRTTYGVPLSWMGDPVPIAVSGRWRVKVSARVQTATAGVVATMSFGLSTSDALDERAAFGYISPNVPASIERETVMDLSAGDSLFTQVRVSAGSVTFYEPRIELTPVRLASS